MQLIYKDDKKGIVKLKVTSLEDLWYLNQIITPKDIVKAKTYRKIKLNQQEERSTKIIKKPITLEIEVEKVEFHKTLNSLRINGRTTEALEDIPKGSFHTINVEQDSTLTITKTWLSYQKEKLKDSLKDTSTKIIICILDRDNSTIFILKNYGPELLLELEGDAQKKAYETKEQKDFYKEIASQLTAINKKYQPTHIIIASPAFWKENVIAYLNPVI
ncbi:pelota family protein, partial [Candidatus Pacearchaeota archaeon]|nr:pelota family protein [Candidatus Pacearchaeota archaeon]